MQGFCLILAFFDTLIISQISLNGLHYKDFSIVQQTLSTYFCDEIGLENEQLTEMQTSKLGWSKAFVSDEIIRGYMDELSDFVEAIALGRPPRSTLDLAIQVTRVLYAAYCSAEEGRRIYLD